MKSSKVIHHTGRDGNVYSNVEKEIEDLRTDVAAAEADITALEDDVATVESDLAGKVSSTQAQLWRAPDIIAEDQKSSGTAGGTATSGSWETRTLNTLTRNVGSLGTLSSNKISLPAGTYYAVWSGGAYFCALHQTRLYDATASAVLGIGSVEYSWNGAAAAYTQRSMGSVVFTISATSDVRLEHRVSVTRSTDGYGRAGSFTTEVYARLELYKIA